MKAVKIFWKDSLSSSSWELMKEAKEVKPVCVTFMPPAIMRLATHFYELGKKEDKHNASDH